MSKNLEKKNEKISEQYIQAGIMLALNNNRESKKIYEDIILSKNKFYSILSLNTILEKNLEEDKNKIFYYFSVLESLNLPSKTVQLVENTDREAVSAMLTSTGEIDIIIPRGGKSLVKKIQDEARVPVFAHLEGICHVYVDKDADINKAVKLIVNSKMRRTGICGALETLLIDKEISEKAVPIIVKNLIESGCHIRGDIETKKIVDEIELASEKDWYTEYLDAILSIKLVDGVSGALDHISKYSSNHTESIITENTSVAETFLTNVDSAIVMHNTSTQFADGGEFGMGAEIGISTGRIHARGPVGAAQLTSFKYIVRGNDQIRG